MIAELPPLSLVARTTHDKQSDAANGIERDAYGEIIYPAFVRPDVPPVQIERDEKGEIIYPSTDYLPMSWTH